MIVSEYLATTGVDPAAVRVFSDAPPLIDLGELQTGLAAWITKCADHPAVDVFPEPPGLKRARERLAELECRIAEEGSELVPDLIFADEQVRDMEVECWMNLGLLIGAQLATRRPLDRAQLVAYVEQVNAAVSVEPCGSAGEGS